VGDLVRLPIADDDVCLAREDGSTRREMSEPGYWLSASVLTMTSAPSRSEASIPAMNAAESPRFLGKRTM